MKTLIFVPTFNERDNAPTMCAEIHRLALDADLLFVDDASPDGTGEILDSLQTTHPRLHVHHRTGKLGIGSAHKDAIAWAYTNNYQRLVTLDCDFTHSPADIPALLATLETHDVAVGSRWMRQGSLPGWNFFRRAMTGLGHALTRYVLGLPYDASGAFRAYRLDRIPPDLFSLVRSNGYSFFFESLFILFKNNFAIRDVPIVLPARTYGSSKMTASAAIRSGRFVFELALAHLRHPENFLLPPPPPKIDPSLGDPQNWDGYWNRTAGKSGLIYDLIAAAYRQTFIKSNIERVVLDTFREHSRLLHAGCGSGQADTLLTSKMQVTALDISPQALRLYATNNGTRAQTVHGSILALPFDENSFDGYYNMGVVEHFPHDDIIRIFREACRVLKPGGKIVIFWPHRRATSVFVLGLWHKIAHAAGRKEFSLHPPEVSLTRGRDEAANLLRQAGLTLCMYRFGPRDLFVQAVVVAEKPAL